MALAKGGDEQIIESIVVVIAHGDTEAKDWNCKSGFMRDVGERAVVIVVIELESRLRAGVCGPVLAIDEQNVGPAIVIVIQECASRPHGLGQVFLSEGGVVVGEADSGLGGDVAKSDLAVC